MDNCKNCNNELIGDYCYKCGYPAHLKRIDAGYITNELGHLFHLEKGFFYTIKELIIRPGKSVREFIQENRNRLVEPIIFLIITSLIYTLIVNFFHIEEEYVNYEPIEESTVSILLKWIQAHTGYSNLIMGFIIAFFAKIFFKKYGYNYFEILILLCFLMGIEMLIVSFFGIIEGFTNVHLQYEATLIGFIYSSWAIGHFFENKLINYLKAGAITVLGTVILIVSIVFIGVSIDLIIRN